MSHRTESDSMGDMTLPENALYGASTQRAVLNFPISGYRFGRSFIRALGLIKEAAAHANHTLGKLDDSRYELIRRAAREIADGAHDCQFPVDIFQTGSGTSTNMNVNEVIANLASMFAGKPLGSKDPVHPNDHVNMGQSSNDVIPTAIHVAAALALREELMPSLQDLEYALQRKANEFDHVLKIGRTHLMDATPVRLGQEFHGYARQIELGRLRTANAISALESLALGGTAVGTGINTHRDFARIAVSFLEASTGIHFKEATNHFEAQGAKDAVVEASGQLKTIAVSLFKIANDIRWMSSGPRCGLGEIALPATQPGSSIMPGKVNPVMCEAVMQVSTQIIGNDAVITWGGANGNLELNVMMPVMAHNFLESIRLLTSAVNIFRDRCIEGITANEDRCNELIELSMSMVTSLAPLIGYDRAAAIAKESASSGRTVRAICEEQQVLPAAELNRALDPASMTHPG